ncbi:MAG: hypothetical protein V3W11_11125 [bacterium]
MLNILCVYIRIVLLISLVGVFFLGPYAFSADDYSWRVDGSHRFLASRFDTAVGFHTLWEHILTYYPNKCGCEIYEAWNFHDMLFEVVMEATPEMEGEEGKAVVAYRAFWDGTDVICTWTFYDDLGSEELRSDSEAFDVDGVSQTYITYSN